MDSLVWCVCINNNNQREKGHEFVREFREMGRVKRKKGIKGHKTVYINKNFNHKQFKFLKTKKNVKDSTPFHIFSEYKMSKNA